MQFLVQVDERDAASVAAALRAGGIVVDEAYGAASLGNGDAVLRCSGDEQTALNAPGVKGVFSDGIIEEAEDSSDPLSGCVDDYEDRHGPLEGCDEPGDPDD